MAKRLCVEEEQEKEDDKQVSAKSLETVNNPPLITLNVDVNRNEARSESERLTDITHPPPKDFVQQRQQLHREVKDKRETLRRLKMVKMYRSKVSEPFQVVWVAPAKNK